MKLTLIVLLVALGMCHARPRWSRHFWRDLDLIDDENTSESNEIEEKPTEKENKPEQTNETGKEEATEEAKEEQEEKEEATEEAKEKEEEKEEATEEAKEEKEKKEEATEEAKEEEEEKEEATEEAKEKEEEKEEATEEAKEEEEEKEEATEEAKEEEEEKEEATEETKEEEEEKEEATEEAKEEKEEKEEEKATEEAKEKEEKEEATEEAKEEEEEKEEATEEAKEEEEEKEEATEEAKGEEEEKEEATEEAKEEEEEKEEATEEAKEEEEEKEEATEEAKEAEKQEGKAAKLSAGQNKASSETMWIFKGDWEEELKGKLVAGKEFLIVYDAARYPYHDTKYGQPAWSIFANYMLNGAGEVQEALLLGPKMYEGKEIMYKKIFIPYGTTSITMWFYGSAYYHPKPHYDSDYGKNYNETVSPPEETTIVFEKNWDEIVYGELERNEKFVVKYAIERLGEGNAVKSVAKYSEHFNEVYSQEMSRPKNGYLTTAYTIPSNAEELIMWFYTGEGDEKQYDSNYGYNYKFPLETV